MAKQKRQFTIRRTDTGAIVATGTYEEMAAHLGKTYDALKSFIRYCQNGTQDKYTIVELDTHIYDSPEAITACLNCKVPAKWCHGEANCRYLKKVVGA